MPPQEVDDIINELIFEEGDKATAYHDSRGYLTLGIGRCVDPRVPGAGLSPSERRYLANNDVLTRRVTLRGMYPWFDALNVPRQNVLIQMSFQDGVEGLSKWKTFLGFISTGHFIDAAADLLSTPYAKEFPARAKRLADQMRTGESQYPPPPQTSTNYNHPR